MMIVASKANGRLATVLDASSARIGLIIGGAINGANVNDANKSASNLVQISRSMLRSC